MRRKCRGGAGAVGRGLGRGAAVALQAGAGGEQAARRGLAVGRSRVSLRRARDGALAPAGAANAEAPRSGRGGVVLTYRARVPDVAPGETGSLAAVVRKAIELVSAADAEGAPRELLIALVITAGESAARIALNSALVDASAYPIAFVIVGVGDGPFESFAALDDDKGQRRFDNVTFVELEKVKAECSAARAPLGAGLALAALAELPQVFADCKKAGVFGAAGAHATAAHKGVWPPAGYGHGHGGAAAAAAAAGAAAAASSSTQRKS